MIMRDYCTELLCGNIMNLRFGAVVPGVHSEEVNGYAH